MKIGFVFECGPQGADKQVCEYLAGKLVPEASFVSRTLDNKANLLSQAATVAAALLDDGCERVLIIWDLRPAWPDMAHKPCRHIERVALQDALEKTGLEGAAPVFLVCIEQELESWILADDDNLSRFLSTDAHAYPVKRIRHPDREKQPKALLIGHFKQARGWRYDDKVHAVKVLSTSEPNWNRLRRSLSFVRFETKILGE
ncbi:MAG: DUF4276 family protein [Desulfuromonadales bacterium]|nr:DUF4276 family protein [Desulfuromonadales bacterium]